MKVNSRFLFSLFILLKISNLKNQASKKQSKIVPNKNRRLFSQHFGHFEPYFYQAPLSQAPIYPSYNNQFTYPMMSPYFNPMGFQMNPFEMNERYEDTSMAEKKLYPDDIGLLNLPGEYPKHMQYAMDTEEADSQNEINEQFGRFNSLKIGEIEDFNRFMGEVIASRPVI